MTIQRKMLFLTLISLGLAAVFLMFGIGKFVDPVKWIDKFTAWGLPAWFVSVAGAIEIAGAIALLIPVLRGLAGIGLALFMIGAVGTHVVHAEIAMIFVASLILILSLMIGWLRLPETFSYLKTFTSHHKVHS